MSVLEFAIWLGESLLAGFSPFVGELFLPGQFYEGLSRVTMTAMLLTGLVAGLCLLASGLRRIEVREVRAMLAVVASGIVLLWLSQVSGMLGVVWTSRTRLLMLPLLWGVAVLGGVLVASNAFASWRAFAMLGWVGRMLTLAFLAGGWYAGFTWRTTDFAIQKLTVFALEALLMIVFVSRLWDERDRHSGMIALASFFGIMALFTDPELLNPARMSMTDMQFGPVGQRPVADGLGGLGAIADGFTTEFMEGLGPGLVLSGYVTLKFGFIWGAAVGLISVFAVDPSSANDERRRVGVFGAITSQVSIAVLVLGIIYGSRLR